MPISATGNSGEAGFTLVEALTSLAVIALLAGAVVLMIPSPDHKTRDIAERFAARVALASDESVIVNRRLGLALKSDGYGFARLEEDGWRDLTGASALAFRTWPEDVRVYFEAEAVEQTGAETYRVQFEPIGAATPASIVIESPSSRWRVDIDGQGTPHVARAP